jgi:hypothetical protein
MNTYKTSNVPLKDFRTFLKLMGAKLVRTRGKHDVYFHKDLPRSIPIQDHIDPVPEFIVLEILNYFDISKRRMWKIIKTGTTEKPKKKSSTTTTKRGKRAKKKQQ